MTHGTLRGSGQQSDQFTLAVHQPLPLGGQHLFDISVEAENYRHKIESFGGFTECSFSLTAQDREIEDWYENGLGRMINVFSHTLVPMWEGFVNQISIDYAGYTLSRGPLLEVQNRVHAVYSQIDTSTTPPTPGLRLKTSVSHHTESQVRYGILPAVLSLAGVTDPNAIKLRDAHLKESAQPAKTQSYSGRGTSITLKIDCLGFIHTLQYPYNHTASGGTQALSDKIVAILEAQPNAWVSNDYSFVKSNSLLVSRWENDDNLAFSILKGLAAIGDEDDQRHILGVYEDRTAHYAPIPTEWEYEIRLSDPNRTIYNRTGGIVPEWAVRPGKWIFYSDFLPGLAPDSEDLREDPRMLFIESLEYSLLTGPLFAGGRLSTVQQRLARLGLAGFSV